MDPITMLAAANAALSLVETLAPQISSLVKSGEIDVASQAALMAKLDSIREKSAFSGPEWAQSGAATENKS